MRKIKSAHSQHRAEFGEIYGEVDETVRLFRESGGLNHVYQHYKLAKLSQILKQEAPKKILELGSGSSTRLFARHVKECDGYLRTIDESEQWLQNSMKLSDVDAGDKHFSFESRPAKISTFEGRDCVGYDINADRVYDLAFIDGPSLRIDGQKRKDAINDDVFRFPKNKLPKMIVVDARYSTVEQLVKHFGAAYTVEKSALVDKVINDNYSYFSVFKRNKA